MPPANENQDHFFLWGMVLLPVLSLCAYIFDAYYYYYRSHVASPSIYEGLLSTIMIVFAYLQYCAPIKSKRLRFVYHLFLWILIEIGHVGYLLSFIYLEKYFSVAIFVGWMICDIIFTMALVYCRVCLKLDHQIEVENKHIFHFISRLEVILAIFIPVFTSQEFSTITRDNIAFFLLFDFFSEKYERFLSVRIKWCLYLFVTTVTISVASEWLYFRFKQHTYEYVTEVSELVSACLCYTLIIMQFSKVYFKQDPPTDTAQDLEVNVIATEHY